MGLSRSGNATHDANIATAEALRQAVYLLSTSTQAQCKTADIAFYRTAVTSGIANSVDVGAYIDALHSLGAGG
jgi:hypothetical protein